MIRKKNEGKFGYKRNTGERYEPKKKIQNRDMKKNLLNLKNLNLKIRLNSMTLNQNPKMK